MRKTVLLVITAFIFIQGPLQAIEELAPEEFEAISSHIVVGKVQAVYSTTEKIEDWEHTDAVAEILVFNVEKGAINVGDVLYAHYWNRKWIGKGDPPKLHSTRQVGASKGDVVRVYLQRGKGRYHVARNAFFSLKPDEVKEAPATEDLQGMWNFAYYEEKGVVQKPGTKQFVIMDNQLDFRANGQSREATTIEVKDGAIDQKFQDGQVYRSIFTRVGNLLIICGNRDENRPTEFAGGTDEGGEFLIVLKRE